METNWDWWETGTEASCAADLAKLTPAEEAECLALVRDVYGDRNASDCSLLCSTYSDGRREAALALMNSLLPNAQQDVDEQHLMQVMVIRTRRRRRRRGGGGGGVEWEKRRWCWALGVGGSLDAVPVCV